MKKTMKGCTEAMKKTTTKKTAAVVTSVGLASVLGLSLAAPASARQITTSECSRGGQITLELTREGRQLEADIEIYAGSRERWTVTISQKGRVVNTTMKTTNREGEFDFWRYMPSRSGAVEVRATSSTGETCRARLRP
jgi:hypothetical protein